jgi:hypothetical protein
MDMKTLKELEEEIDRIKSRNQRVEADKAWETSFTRRMFISMSTYVLMVIFMAVLQVDKPFVSAVIPAVAYLISTVSLGMLKSWWLRNQ